MCLCVGKLGEEVECLGWYEDVAFEGDGGSLSRCNRSALCAEAKRLLLPTTGRGIQTHAGEPY